MTLLSPQESFAFQSFLAHIDGDDALDFAYTNHDWPFFTNNGISAAGPSNVNHAQLQPRLQVIGPSQSSVLDNAIHDADADHPPEVVKFAAEAHVQALPRVDGERKHLALATKSLMSLDSNPLKWSESADRDIPVPHRTRNGSSAGSSATSSMHGSAYKLPMHNSEASSPSASTSATAQRMNAIASSSKPPLVAPTPPSSANGVNVKRPFDDESYTLPTTSSIDYSIASASSVSSPSSTQAGPVQKKQRSSTPQRRVPQPPSNQPTMSTKSATLLTPSQKKANHIQSEQKRRANIRRGYDALCETVPALREAIRAEEEAQALVAEQNGDTKPKRKRGPRKKGAADGEKVDGRAGPRSENVVLSKTIDYIRDLLSERGMLLERLQQARQRLPSEHPLRSSSPCVPLWEREWTGGLGKDLGLDGDGDEDMEEDGGSESEG